MVLVIGLCCADFIFSFLSQFILMACFVSWLDFFFVGIVRFQILLNFYVHLDSKNCHFPGQRFG